MYGAGFPNGDCSSSSLLSGCVLGSEMMPTLAQRVWPSTDTAGIRGRDRPTQQVVGDDRRPQRRRVVAEFTDLGGRLVHEREHLAATRAPSRTGTWDRR